MTPLGPVRPTCPVGTCRPSPQPPLCGLCSWLEDLELLGFTPTPVLALGGGAEMCEKL